MVIAATKKAISLQKIKDYFERFNFLPANAKIISVREDFNCAVFDIRMRLLQLKNHENKEFFLNLDNDRTSFVPTPGDCYDANEVLDSAVYFFSELHEPIVGNMLFERIARPISTRTAAK